MDKVRQYVGKFNGIGRFSKTTVAPGPGMEDFLDEFEKDDAVIVFNATDFFKWHDMVFQLIEDLQKQNRHQKIKGLITSKSMWQVPERVDDTYEEKNTEKWDVVRKGRMKG